MVFLEGRLHGPQLQSVVMATLILQALRNHFFPCNWLTRVPFPLIKCEIQKPWSKSTVFHGVTLLVSIGASWLYQAMAQTWPGTFL